MIAWLLLKDYKFIKGDILNFEPKPRWALEFMIKVGIIGSGNWALALTKF